jgi:hypothetical protein
MNITVICLGYIGFVCFTDNLFSSSTAKWQNDTYQTVLFLLLISENFSPLTLLKFIRKSSCVYYHAY